MDKRFALREIAAKWMPLAWECEVSSAWHLWQLARRVLVGCHGTRAQPTAILGPGKIRDVADCVTSEYEHLQAVAREGEEELGRMPDPRGRDFALDALLRDLEGLHGRQLDALSSRLSDLEESSRKALRSADAEVRRVIDESIDAANAHIDDPDQIERIGKAGATSVARVLDGFIEVEESAWFGHGDVPRAMEPYLASNAREITEVVTRLSAFASENDELEAYLGQLLFARAARLCLRGLEHPRSIIHAACELLDDIKALQSSFDSKEDSERY